MSEASGRTGKVVIVTGVIRRLGAPYVDGTPRLEIHFPLTDAERLPCQQGTRVAIELWIDEVAYRAGLRSTARNDYLWICPDIYDTEGKRMKLGRVLTGAGLRANQNIEIRCEGTALRVLMPAHRA